MAEQQAPEEYKFCGFNFANKSVVTNFIFTTIAMGVAPISTYFIANWILSNYFKMNEGSSFQYAGFSSVIVVMMIMSVYAILAYKDQNNYDEQAIIQQKEYYKNKEQKKQMEEKEKQQLLNKEKNKNLKKKNE